MKLLYAHLFLAWLVACYIVGCAAPEKPRAQPEHHPLKLMEWLQKYGEENEN